MVTATIPRLITVVEIVKREYLERLKARRSSSLVGVHQYNEVGALQDLSSTDVSPPDVTELLSGSKLVALSRFIRVLLMIHAASKSRRPFL